MGRYVCFGVYVCLCSGFRGGAPPVMDGIVPEHGPEVDLTTCFRRAWFVCLTEVFLC
jgi:hypothetical protein